MADITMCVNEECPLKLECKRYIATPSHWQSYFMPSPEVNKNKCKHFWKATKGDKERYKKRKEEGK